MIHINNRDPRPIYEQICDNFRRLIVSGVLQPDEKLPSVRELAGELAINPNTIQRAYRELEAAGWIATVPGKGCFVCQKETEDGHIFAEFDALVANLYQQGVTAETLIARLKGGNRDA